MNLPATNDAERSDAVTSDAATPDPAAPDVVPSARRPAAAARRRVRWHRDALAALPDAGALAARLLSGSRYAYWLDSASAGIPGGAPARWSVMGIGREVLRQHRQGDPVRDAAGRPVGGEASILTALAERLDTPRADLEARPDFAADEPADGAVAAGGPAANLPADLPPEVAELARGWVGWLGYEVKDQLDAVRPRQRAHRSPAESGPAPQVPAVHDPGPFPGLSFPRDRPDDAQDGLPDALWIRVEDVVVMDHAAGDLWAIGSPEWLERVDHALSRLGAGTGGAADDAEDTEPPAPVAFPRPDREEYVRRIRACLESIRRGDSYEICLTAQTEAVLDAPLDLGLALRAYRAQRRRNPAPHAAFLWTPGAAVLSSSPERFLRVDARGWCEAKPIKGTIPRGADPGQDAARAAWLRQDPKTRAENLMIVDLMRNDLSRVCEPATIQVPVLMAVESYRSVHQLVSTVRGRLRAGLGPVELLRAAFPAGSMTGAPKPRTVEIIAALEGRRRGVYSGALGRLGPGGTDLSVVIRTVVLSAEGARTRAAVAAGGAIVADSDPEAEYEEMLAKLRAPLPPGWELGPA